MISAMFLIKKFISFQKEILKFRDILINSIVKIVNMNKFLLIIIIVKIIIKMIIRTVNKFKKIFNN